MFGDIALDSTVLLYCIVVLFHTTGALESPGLLPSCSIITTTISLNLHLHL